MSEIMGTFAWTPEIESIKTTWGGEYTDDYWKTLPEDMRANTVEAAKISKSTIIFLRTHESVANKPEGKKNSFYQEYSVFLKKLTPCRDRIDGKFIPLVINQCSAYFNHLYTENGLFGDELEWELDFAEAQVDFILAKEWSPMLSEQIRQWGGAINVQWHRFSVEEKLQFRRAAESYQDFADRLDKLNDPLLIPDNRISQFIGLKEEIRNSEKNISDRSKKGLFNTFIHNSICNYVALFNNPDIGNVCKENNELLQSYLESYKFAKSNLKFLLEQEVPEKL